MAEKLDATSSAQGMSYNGITGAEDSASKLANQ